MTIAGQTYAWGTPSTVGDTEFRKTSERSVAVHLGSRRHWYGQDRPGARISKTCHASIGFLGLSTALPPSAVRLIHRHAAPTYENIKAEGRGRALTPTPHSHTLPSSLLSRLLLFPFLSCLRRGFHEEKPSV
ncbi:hypothetical protein OPV22_010271 [Ensete ventricosum]|uniref:Uncharacterized protein n=1 Tax=Ensete ventricosum TaxID=4639 RepID=A0AAV8PV83_ENSVE|nr:hypothetical protein OPV22_010271 [Ensete ventricosum]